MRIAIGNGDSPSPATKYPARSRHGSRASARGVRAEQPQPVRGAGQDGVLAVHAALFGVEHVVVERDAGATRQSRDDDAGDRSLGCSPVGSACRPR